MNSTYVHTFRCSIYKTRIPKQPHSPIRCYERRPQGPPSCTSPSHHTHHTTTPPKMAYYPTNTHQATIPNEKYNQKPLTPNTGDHLNNPRTRKSSPNGSPPPTLIIPSYLSANSTSISPSYHYQEPLRHLYAHLSLESSQKLANIITKFCSCIGDKEEASLSLKNTRILTDSPDPDTNPKTLVDKKNYSLEKYFPT